MLCYNGKIALILIVRIWVWILNIKAIKLD